MGRLLDENDVYALFGRSGTAHLHVADIDMLPRVDAVEVVHGRWDVEVGMNYNKERICPVCNKHIESNYWNYCPNCGTKMEAKVKHYDG